MSAPKKPGPVGPRPPFVAALHDKGKWLISKPELPPIVLEKR